MLAMQVNHSPPSFLPSLLAPLSLSLSHSHRFLLALILGTFRFSLPLSLFSISLYPLLTPLQDLPFIQFTLSFVAMEGEKATYVRCIAYHAAFSSLSFSSDQRYYTIVSFSLRSLPSSFPRNQILRFPTRAMWHKKTKCDEAELRAKEREDESKATNKFSGITLSARADRTHLETRHPTR